MNYHNITYPDMNNGDGLRVTLWLSGCNHHCYNCQNPQTWDANSGILFDKFAKEELFKELDKNYISGLTLSGGDPLYETNLDDVLDIVTEFNRRYKNDTICSYFGTNNHNIMNKNTDEICLSFGSQKTIWIYSGYTWEEIFPPVQKSELTHKEMTRQLIVKQCTILVDGQYIDAERDVTLKWRGSNNQRVIDVQKSLQKKEIILWAD